MESFKFPSKEVMVSELQSKNVGFDFVKQKHSITMKTNIDNKNNTVTFIWDKLEKKVYNISFTIKLSL